MNQKEFKGREVLGMIIISEDNPYSKTSKLKDETFTNFQLKGHVISVNDKYRFKEDHDKSNIYSVTVAETQIDAEEGGKRTVWSFVEYTTIQGEVVMAQAENKIRTALGMIDKESLATVAVTEMEED